MNKIKELFKKYKEVIMYLIFGVLTTLVNIICTVILNKCFGLSADNYINTSISWFMAVLFAFVTNRKFVFESKEKNILLEMLKFYGSRAFSGLFEIFLPKFFVFLAGNVGFLKFLGNPFRIVLGGKTVYELDGGIAKLVTMVVVIVLNYVLSKLIVFRKKDEPEKEQPEPENPDTKQSEPENPEKEQNK